MKNMRIPGGSERRHARSFVREWSAAHGPRSHQRGSRKSWRCIQTTVPTEPINTMRFDPCTSRKGTHADLQNDAPSRVNVEVVEAVRVVAGQPDAGHGLAERNARAEATLASELDKRTTHGSVAIVVRAVARYGGVPSATREAGGPGSRVTGDIVVVSVATVELALISYKPVEIISTCVNGPQRAPAYLVRRCTG